MWATRRVGMIDGSGWTASGYDLVGRVSGLTKNINGITKSASVAYNLDGTPQSFADFVGVAFTPGYDSTGRPVSLAVGGVNVATGGTYDAAGQIGSLVQGPVTVTNSFNKLLQPSLLSAQTAGATVMSLSYGYGAAGQNNGNIQLIQNNVDNTRSQTYTYDYLNRLSKAQEGTRWGNSYGYDPWGNLLQKTVISGVATGETLSLTAGVTNQVSGMTYDLAGNVLTDNLGNHWTYDAEGRPLTGGGNTYVYDGDGKRVMRSGGTSPRMWWPGVAGSSWTETDLTGTLVQRDIYFGGQLIARSDANGTIHQMVRDHLGSARVSVSTSGQVEDNIDYYPWGAQAPPSTSTSGNANTFADYLSDPETSTYHTDFRQVSYTAGRWLRPDPYDGSYDVTNPQSLNRYSYVGNNPLGFVDPLGLDECFTTTIYDQDGNFISTSESCTVTVTADDSGDGGFFFPGPGLYIIFPYQPIVNVAPNSGCQLVAPTGQYRATPGTIALFQPSFADRLNAGIAALNDQGITPVFTDGYRTQAMQNARRSAASSGASLFGAAQGISAHQVGLAADFGVNSNAGNNAAILNAMTAAGLVNGANFKPSDPVHYNLPNARQSQNPATAASCAASYSGR